MTSTHFASALALANFALLTMLALGGDATHAEPTVAPVLRAELIELVDAKGQVRAQMKTEDDGTVVLRLRDQAGTVRVKLAADARGSGLLLADDTTDVGVHILSGISSVTNARATAITIGEPGGAKTVIGPGGVK